MAKQEEKHHQQMEAHHKQVEGLMKRLDTGSPAPIAPAASVPCFTAFDSTSELWSDYLARFNTFVGANSIRVEKIAQVFLTNQTTTTYKLLSILAGQQTPPQDLNGLSVDDITNFMQNQFDPVVKLSN